MVLVSAMHITSGVFINDAEPGLHCDIEEWLLKLIPEGHDYYHHRTGEVNGDAHLRNLLIGHQIIIPVSGGKTRPRNVAKGILCRIRRTTQQASYYQSHGRIISLEDVIVQRSRNQNRMSLKKLIYKLCKTLISNIEIQNKSK